MEEPTSSSELYKSLERYSDVTIYLNELLDSKDSTNAGQTSGDLLGLERYVTRLSAIFELAREETSAHVEHTIEEISRNVPRLTYDLQLMRQSALSLQLALHSVDDVSKKTSDVDELISSRSETTVREHKLKYKCSIVKQRGRYYKTRQAVKRSKQWDRESAVIGLECSTSRGVIIPARKDVR